VETLLGNDLLLLLHCSEPLGHTYDGKGDTTPELLYPFIARFPKLKLICAHWGGGLPFYALMPEVKKALSNVYFDSAASPYLYEPAVYSQVCAAAGEEHVLFGTDYPLLRPKRLLREIDALNLPTDTRRRILGENAQRLLRMAGLKAEAGTKETGDGD
jgi:predicted TIM-barrel fold metal-dependent hydrolase